jgi:hypothetical protein
MEPNGSGIWPTSTSRVRCRSWIYHARQHLWDLARKLYPNHLANQEAWIKIHQKRLLDTGKIENLVLSLHSLDSSNTEVLEKIRTESDYFERNAERLRYPKFRRQHLFVGSGVIEAGCKTIIASRLKESGMFWTICGANSIIALRCCSLLSPQRSLRRLFGVPPPDAHFYVAHPDGLLDSKFGLCVVRLSITAHLSFGPVAAEPEDEATLDRKVTRALSVVCSHHRPHCGRKIRRSC